MSREMVIQAIPVKIKMESKCTECKKELLHIYDCKCILDESNDDMPIFCKGDGECSYYYCDVCKEEQKDFNVEAEKKLIDDRPEEISKMTMLNGDPIMKDEERHWSERELTAINKLLKGLSSPNARWESSDELARNVAVVSP